MPRQGLGMPIVSGASNAPVTVIDDVLWEDFGGSGGEIAVNYQETRTNVVLHSQDTTDAEAWTKTNTAIDSTLYEAPDNSTTANAIKSNSTGTKVYRILQGSLSVTTGKTYTLSVHVKKGTLGFARVQFNDSSVDYSADFNLNTAAVTNTSNTIRTQVDSMDDDWYRCSITFQAQNTTSSGVAYVFAQSAAGSSTPNVAVSDVILLYVWGFQLEESIEATSYIVTTTEARTRTTTLNDTSDVWDFDSADIMPEADPDSEGVWETPDNIVLNSDYEELGSEIITNGGFDTDSDWSKQTGWSIADGVASSVASGNGQDLQQSVGGKITSGKTYKIEYTISNHTAGGVKTFLSGGGAVQGNTNTANGTYTDYLTAPANNTTFKFTTADGGFTGSIDNVSVKQVDPNDRWTLGTGWSISDGKANFDGSSTAFLQQDPSSNGIVIGNVYEVTFTVSGYVSGSVRSSLGGYSHGSATRSANGTYTEIITVTESGANDSFYLHASSAPGEFSIDNFTVTEYAIQPQDV